MSSENAEHQGATTRDTRDAILQAALTVLVDEGHRALTVRRVATKAGCSTIGVYTWFGGKEGLVDALLVQGFRSFATALRRAGGRDPLERLHRQAEVYRRWALRHPMHYRVMFMNAIPDCEPGKEAAEAGLVAFSLLHDAVKAAKAAGLLWSDDDYAVAMALWGTVHGMVSLELLATAPPIDALTRGSNQRSFQTATEALLRGLARAE